METTFYNMAFVNVVAINLFLFRIIKYISVLHPSKGDLISDEGNMFFITSSILRNSYL